MSESASDDTPAGRTLAEHRALRTLIHEIEEASGAEGAANHEALTSRLGALREQLAVHFDGEERSGLFDQIQELAPEQAHECAKLCDEHLDLLRQLDELRGADDAARVEAAWGRELRDLLARLDRHEARENDLLTRVLDGSMEAQD